MINWLFRESDGKARMSSCARPTARVSVFRGAAGEPGTGGARGETETELISWTCACAATAVDRGLHGAHCASTSGGATASQRYRHTTQTMRAQLRRGSERGLRLEASISCSYARARMVSALCRKGPLPHVSCPRCIAHAHAKRSHPLRRALVDGLATGARREPPRRRAAGQGGTPPRAQLWPHGRVQGLPVAWVRPRAARRQCRAHVQCPRQVHCPCLPTLCCDFRANSKGGT